MGKIEVPKKKKKVILNKQFGKNFVAMGENKVF